MSVAFIVKSPARGALTSVCAAAVLLSVCLLTGCATVEPQASPRPAEPIAAPPPTTQVYVYPTGGQTAGQLDRDRYECHAWAVKQSNFDPSKVQLAPHQRTQVVAMPPPGATVAAGAVTGAVVGAAVSRPHNAGGGALIGAMAGAMLGAAADSAHQQQADAEQRRYDQRDAQDTARLDQQAGGYRRAISACLEGRGYTVK